MSAVSMPAVDPNLWHWLREGARSAFGAAPRWPAARAGAGLVLALIAVSLLLGVAVHRLHVDGPASFYPPALLGGWLPVLALSWVCWRLAPARGGTVGAVQASALFALCTAQLLIVGLLCNLIASVTGEQAGPPLQWAVWAGSLLWYVAAPGWLLWRASLAPRRRRLAAIALLVAASWLEAEFNPLRPWSPREPGDDASRWLQLSPEMMERQMVALPLALQALAPQQPGRIDVYVLTFSPYGDEDVFRRESDLVAGVLRDRFGTDGRTLQLLNHPRTAAELPWATPANLERALNRLGQLIDADEDIVFVHLGSHGAQDGRLAATLWPLALDELTPQSLKAMLDGAGIKHRVISVSACYSGSWVAPLRDQHTLVMTAADIDTTSYGCGRKSEMTFFGRAVFGEALRSTLSFEQALQQARNVIAQRERDAGKDDGFSNPQIAVGQAIRERLARLERQLQNAPR